MHATISRTLFHRAGNAGNGGKGRGTVRAGGKFIAGTIALVLTCPLADKTAADDGRLPGDAINEIRPGYVTPHIEWGRPWARGRLRVFFILPHTSAAREAVELAQRLDIEICGETTVNSRELGSEGRYIAPIEGTRPAEKVARLRRKLKERYDAFVIGNVQWRIFPAEIQYRILRRVADGAGLVIVYPSGVRPEMLKHKLAEPVMDIARGVPWAGLQLFRERFASDARYTAEEAARSTITTAAFGKGRIAVIDYHKASNTYYGGFGLTPPDEYRFETAASYEGYHVLVARALLWAARRFPRVRFTGWPGEPGTVYTIRNGDPVQARRFRIGLSAAADVDPATKLSLRLTVRNVWNEPEYSKQIDVGLDATRAGDAEFALPALPAGTYFADIVVGSSHGVENFGAFTVRVTPGDLHLTDIVLDRPGWERTESLSALVRLSGNAPRGASLRCVLLDNYGREFERVRVPVREKSRDVPVSIPLDRAVSMCGRLRVELVLPSRNGEGAVADRREIVFYVRKHPLDRYPYQMREYPVLIWGTLPGILGHFAYVQLRRAGFTAVLTHVGNDGKMGRRLARDDLMTVPYCARVGTRFPIGGSGPVCFADPAFRRAQKKAVQAKAAPLKTVAPLVFSLGDENFIPSDAGTHPADKPAFAEFLRRRYGSIETLNAVWNVQCADFAEAAALAPKKGTPAQFARDFAFDAFRKWEYAGFHHFLADCIRETNPGARVGAEGSQPGDLEETVRGLQFWGPYRRLRYNTLLRSVAPRELLRGNWFGGYLSQRRDPLALPDFVWQALFDGNNLIEYYCISTAERIFDTGFNFGPWNQRFRPAFQDIVECLGALTAASSVDVDAVALLHSEGSLFTQRWLPASGYKEEHEAWLQLLSDIGIQTFYLTSRHLAAGRLRTAGIRVLILPAISCLSDKEAAEIRRFVKEGGTVVADQPPGLFDGYGRPRGHGALDDVFGIQSCRKSLGTVSAVPEASTGDDQNEATLFVDITFPSTTVFTGVRADSAIVCGKAAGHPVFLVHRFGRGRAILLNAWVAAYPGWRHGAQDLPVRTLVLRTLEAAGVRPFADVLDAGSRKPLRAVRQVRYRRGDCTWIGLLRLPGFDNNRPREALVRLRSPAWVADLRTQRRFGRTRTVRVRLAPGHGVVLGVLPEPIARVSVSLPRNVTLGSDVPVTAALRGPWWRFGRRPHLKGLVWRLQVRGPDGNLRRWYCDTRYTDEPRARFRIPLAWNDPPGEWQVRVSCVSTGTARTMNMEVYTSP